MAIKRTGNMIDGIVIINKPKGLSSNQALQKVKRLFNAQKAGHTGSLDPMASGVLPICFGRATRISQYLLDADKTYRARIQLGVATDTGDAEGTVTEQATVPDMTESKLLKVLAQFKGEILQIPPMFSALKHQGKPLYQLARSGIEIERCPRKVTILNLDMLNYDSEKQIIDILVTCTKGTYIRTLAEDIAKAVGCCGHLIGLVRTRCGILSEEKMQDIETLSTLAQQERDKHILNVELAFTDKPVFTITENEAKRFYQTGKLTDTQELNGIVRLYAGKNFIAIGLFDHGVLSKKQFFTRH